jgi:methyl-accepting chemotaxis protein
MGMNKFVLGSTLCLVLAALPAVAKIANVNDIYAQTQTAFNTPSGFTDSGSIKIYQGSFDTPSEITDAVYDHKLTYRLMLKITHFHEVSTYFGLGKKEIRKSVRYVLIQKWNVQSQDGKSVEKGFSFPAAQLYSEILSDQLEFDKGDTFELVATVKGDVAQKNLNGTISYATQDFSSLLGSAQPRVLPDTRTIEEQIAASNDPALQTTLVTIKQKRDAEVVQKQNEEKMAEQKHALEVAAAEAEARANDLSNQLSAQNVQLSVQADSINQLTNKIGKMDAALLTVAQQGTNNAVVISKVMDVVQQATNAINQVSRNENETRDAVNRLAKQTAETQNTANAVKFQQEKPGYFTRAYRWVKSFWSDEKYPDETPAAPAEPITNLPNMPILWQPGGNYIMIDGENRPLLNPQLPIGQQLQLFNTNTN